MGWGSWRKREFWKDHQGFNMAHTAFAVFSKLPKMCPVNSYSMKGKAQGSAFKETHEMLKVGQEKTVPY